MKKICFVILGIISTIFGIVCYAMNTGSYESSLTYGGDAYTGIQNASAQTANNIQHLTSVVKFGFGSILLIIGLVLIIYALTSGTSVPAMLRPNTEKNSNTSSVITAETTSLATNPAGSKQDNDYQQGELEKFQKLLEDGAISQEEFDAKKAQLLS